MLQYKASFDENTFQFSLTIKKKLKWKTFSCNPILKFQIINVFPLEGHPQCSKLHLTKFFCQGSESRYFPCRELYHRPPHTHTHTGFFVYGLHCLLFLIFVFLILILVSLLSSFVFKFILYMNIYLEGIYTGVLEYGAGAIVYRDLLSILERLRRAGCGGAHL